MSSPASEVAIERQLGHQEPNEIRAAYNYAKRLPERRKMMQAWADYLYRLRASNTSNPPKGRGSVQAQA